MKFSEINLHPLLQANLDQIQFVECTQIQEQAIPLLRTGKDVAGLAQTGTGKTAAFFVPLIDRVLKSRPAEQAPPESATVAFAEWKKRHFILVLVPTRELADQVQETARKLIENTGLSSVAVYGGTTYDKQVAALKSGVEFVIATPGRLIDLYKEHVADLGMVRAIVFDEADRMFDMGFKDDMKFILRRVPRERQFTVFSATLNFDVLNVAYEYGSEPVEINISRDQAKAENVKDHIIHLGQNDKPQHLLSILKKYEPRQAIIFSNFKHNVEKITRFLTANRIPAVGISSLMTQGQRNRVMAQFRAESDRNILVATDLAARGLDILGVDLVVNYELPDDAENYVHRIGRTGRAGQTGNAISLVSDRDVDALQRIEDFLKHKVEAVWFDEAELVAEYEPFPRDEERFRKPGFGRRDRAGGDRQGRDGGGRGPRRDRGDRGGPRGERASHGGGGAAGRRDRESHRDRHTGRHRDAGAGASGGGGGRQAEGGTQGTALAASGSNSQRGREGQNRNRQRHHRGSGPRPGSSHPPGQGAHRHSGEGRRHQGGGASRRPHGGGGSRGPNPPPVAAASSGIGARVSGFFKKLFGG